MDAVHAGLCVLQMSGTSKSCDEVTLHLPNAICIVVLVNDKHSHVPFFIVGLTPNFWVSSDANSKETKNHSEGSALAGYVVPNGCVGVGML